MTVRCVIGGASQPFETERLLEQRFCEGGRLRDRWSVYPRPGLPMRLSNTEIAGDLIAKRSALGTMIIGRRFGVGRCRRNLGQFFRADQTAFDINRRQTDLGGPLQMARHYSPSGSKT